MKRIQEIVTNYHNKDYVRVENDLRNMGTDLGLTSSEKAEG